MESSMIINKNTKKQTIKLYAQFIEFRIGGNIYIYNLIEYKMSDFHALR